MVENKRKKFHDKDKYYRLAKEQGLRSRAAFKLSQINRKFPVLETATTAVLDLCAAPGGWTQIAARTCCSGSGSSSGNSGNSSVKIVAVDILPIRRIPGHRNNSITTIVGDITTDKCKSDIQRALSGLLSNSSQQAQVEMKNGRPQKQQSPHNACKVDVVLHDGAPNIGADYARDAYVQNELALHALKCATQHLKPTTGTFITKVYRSRDYAAYHWVLQQLFDTVTAFKPAASRQASAEIFLICAGYKGGKIDPKLLDPKHVFASVEEGNGNNENGDATTTTGGGKAGTVFDKGWDKPVRRRGGYDMDHLDGTMRHVVPAEQFVTCGNSSSSTNMKDAIRLLSTSTGLAFQCPQCNNSSNTTNNTPKPTTMCHCSFLLHHPFTTTEIKECAADLQVLNKSDFKGLLGWRTKMQDALRAVKEQQQGDDDDDSDLEKDAQERKGRTNDDDDDDDDSQEAGSEDDDSEQEEAEIQKEMEEMRARRQRERKRLKKKERAVTAKRRKQAALGMDLNAIDIPEHDKVFSLASITSAGALEAVHEINLDRVTDEQLFGGSDDDADVVVGGRAAAGAAGSDDDSESDDENGTEEARRLKRERDLDEAYNQYLESTRDGLAVSGTKMAKRSKKYQRQKVAEEAEEDTEMALTGAAAVSHDAKTYAKMLQGAPDSDDDNDGSSDDELEEREDDGFHADPMTPAEHIAAASAKKKEPNPLIHKFADNEATSLKTARWFSNPLFASIGKSVESATTGNGSGGGGTKTKPDARDGDDENAMSESDGDDKVKNDEPEMKKQKGHETNRNKKREKKDSNSSSKLTADDVLASMPRTDKQIRHEKRLKQMERYERKKAKRAKKLGDTESEFQLVAGNASDNDDSDDGEADRNKLDHLSDAQKKRVLDARDLIKAGLGRAGVDDGNVKSGIEIVSQEDTNTRQASGKKRPLPIMDERKYDSDHEDYDSDDYAQTLALGTMMLRRSKEKAFVDASYNRYAWNDPSDLPEWFVDDENKHYKPQLPIPPALLAKMKEKMMALSAKPIAKVAEARARKSKRAKVKLAAAKKQAEAVANSTEMSEAMKLKAISKALTGQDKQRPGKKYVVAKKGRGNVGVKGAKLVDKRLKSDKRSMDRVERNRKKGKQNGMTGSKKRRNHK